MKKILFVILFFLCLFPVVGCEKDNEKISSGDLSANHYTLSYAAGENGSIEGINQQTVAPGSSGSLVKAIPIENYHFASWSDGVTTASRTDMNITANLAVTANFAINQYNLTYTAGENGAIDGDSSQKIDHGGAGIPVTAKPDTGYHFMNWSDGVETASRSDANIQADLSVTANFANNQYTLTYSAGKNGSIDGSNIQTVKHGGSGNHVKAIPSDNHHFDSWSDGVTTASRTDMNITANLAVTANFAINQYTLTYTAGENGAIDGDSSQKIDHGGAGIPVTAKPDTGYHFMNWSDGVETASRSDSNIQADLAVTASFAINKYSLTYTAEEHGMIEGINQQTVEHGGSASAVTAVPEKGFHFVNWNDGVSTAQRIDSSVTGDLSVRAVFEINTYTVGGSVSGLIEGTQLVLQNNGGDDLAINFNGEFNFTTESLDRTAYEISVLTQPVTPNQICTITSGTGTISGENVTDIRVTCIPVTYTISGTVSGLTEGDHIVLQINESDDLVIGVNGDFTFSKSLDDGSEYEVTISSQPKRPNWTCELENASGFLQGKNVADVIVDCFPKAVLQAKAGIRKIKLKWNSEDFSEVTFNLCITQDNMPPDGFNSCQEIKGGIIEINIKNPLTIFKLTNDNPYWFQLEALYGSGRQTLSEVVMAIPFGGLNDSGIDWCADDSTNRDLDGTRPQKTASCAALRANYPNQDAFHGRDALFRARDLDKTGYGTAGFDFTKMCMSGDAAGEGQCPPNPSPGNGPNNWACNRDNVTGLTWEIKTDSSLRNRSNTYTWYNPNDTVNGGDPGLKNGGKCEESDCDTEAYIQAINDRALCGADNWRLPTKRELLSIVNNGRFKPAIDVRFFPNTLSSYYWSSSPYSEDENSAWQVYFLYGEVSPNNKSQNNHIRLVQGRTVTFGLDNP